MKKLLFALAILLFPFSAFAGSQVYDTPGVHTFKVPEYGTLTVQMWGAGGGGGGAGIYAPKADSGGNTTFQGLLAGGGEGAYPFTLTVNASGCTPHAPTSGGMASGGDVNIPGNPGQGQAQSWYCPPGAGATAPVQGSLGAYQGLVGDGGNGMVWNGVFGAQGGGSGGYVKKTYQEGDLPEDTVINLSVGSLGHGGDPLCWVIPYTGCSSGGANGKPGLVLITWSDSEQSCPIHSHGTYPACICDTGYVGNGQTGSNLVCTPIVPTCAVTFSKNPINKGDNSTLSYTSANAVWTSINNVGFVNENTNGSFNVSPIVTTDYTCTVADVAGNQYNYPATLTVNSNSCPAGQHWNGTACVPDNCPSGQHWDVVQNKCVSDCPAGQHWNGTQCVPDTCPVGQHWDGTQCVNDNCPIGTHWDGTQCVSNSCPLGTHWNGTACVPDNCPANTHWNGTACVPDNCPAGTHWNGTQCVSNCPVGQHWNGTQCVPDVPAPIVVLWKVAPLLVKQGNTVTVSWQVQNVTSCTVRSNNGDSWTGLSDVQISRPINHQTIFTLHCLALSGSGAADVNRTATVNIVPVFKEK